MSGRRFTQNIIARLTACSGTSGTKPVTLLLRLLHSLQWKTVYALNALCERERMCGLTLWSDVNFNIFLREGHCVWQVGSWCFLLSCITYAYYVSVFGSAFFFYGSQTIFQSLALISQRSSKIVLFFSWFYEDVPGTRATEDVLQSLRRYRLMTNQSCSQIDTTFFFI